MFQNRLVPLECNKAGIEFWKKQEDEVLGDSAKAKANQKRWGSLLTNSLKQSDAKYGEDLRKYAGQIINKNIDLMVYTSSIMTSLLEVVSVRGLDIPAYTTGITPSITIWRMSGHGYPVAETKYMSKIQYFPTFYRLTTPRIYQPRQSILTGNVGPDQEINRMARYSMEQQIEDDAWTLITGALGTFDSTTWVYDDRIQNLPTTNTLDLSAHGGLTIGMFRALLAAVDKIPSRANPRRSAQIRNILAPSDAIQDIRQWVSVVSTTSGQTQTQDGANTVSPDTQRVLETAGPLIASMWGQHIGLQSVNRLMGTSTADWSKYLWVFLDGPLGRLYLKPDEDWSTRLTNMEPEMEGFVMSKVIALETPGPYKPNFLRVKFKT